MKAVNKYVFEVPEKEAYTTKLGETEIFFDAGFGSEYDNMVHYGVLVAKPKSAKLDIEVGELVYFSHLAKSFESRIQVKDKVYYCLDRPFAEGVDELYQTILCTENRALGNVTMVERIEEPEENYKVGGIFLKPKPDNLKNQFKVVASKVLDKGTEIIISDDADYDFLDRDKQERVAVQNKHIMAVVKDGELEPFGNYAIVEPEDDNADDYVNKNGVFVSSDKVLRGWGKWKGKRIFYHKVNSNSFEYKKNKLSGCELKDIYYICD